MSDWKTTLRKRLVRRDVKLKICSLHQGKSATWTTIQDLSSTLTASSGTLFGTSASWWIDSSMIWLFFSRNEKEMVLDSQQSFRTGKKILVRAQIFAQRRILIFFNLQKSVFVHLQLKLKLTGWWTGSLVELRLKKWSRHHHEPTDDVTNYFFDQL